jgi:hypothetical protein
MVFLADSIPVELRRVVEFLNEQMDPAEVLAIEVKQYIGEGMTTLVPRVLGQTEAAQKRKGVGASGGKEWDETSFLEALAATKGPVAVSVAKEMLDWIAPRVNRVWWGRGAQIGGVVPMIVAGATRYQLFRMSSSGKFIIRFDWLHKKPPFTADAVRHLWLTKINEIPGIVVDATAITKPVRIPIETLAKPDVTPRIKSLIEWAIDEIKSANSRTPPPTSPIPNPGS